MTPKPQPAPEKEPYLAAIRAALDSGAPSSWLARRRATAAARFEALSFPSTRDEEWKYTSVAAIENGGFNLLPPAVPAAAAELVAAHALPDGHLLVFVDGRLAPALCRLGRLPAGVVLGSLAQQLDNDAAFAAGPLLAPPASAFVDLNLAFMADGAYLALPPGVRVAAPIQWL